MEPAKIYRLNRDQTATSSAAPTASAPASAAKPKLLDQIRQAIRTRHYSYMTEKAYVSWTKRFIFFHNKRHPAEMGETEIAQFLSALAQERHVSASTQNQALNALLFLYHEVLGKEIGYVSGVVRAKKANQTTGCIEPSRSQIGFIIALWN
jgi:Phage integrase, N-terminal SAM-like domain